MLLYRQTDEGSSQVYSVSSVCVVVTRRVGGWVGGWNMRLLGVAKEIVGGVSRQETGVGTRAVLVDRRQELAHGQD